MKARALELARGALAAIEAARPRIDDLNVYPVPDGDTGTNLSLTVRAMVEALEVSTTDERAALAHELSRAALMGARGNSGVILSQIVRGAAESLGGSDDLAAALRAASDAAYRAVRKPVEGTMLTAIRELAEEAERGSDLAAILTRGEDCVVRTQQMLPVLAEAGVVDAGAAGLVEILRGIVSALAGQPLPEPTREAWTAPSFESVHQELSRFTYCTGFVVEGERLDAQALERELEPLGDSMLVVGDSTALKVHIHTDDPGRALSLAVARGSLANVEIANMHVQTLEREQRLLRAVPEPAEACAVVAVVAGAGNALLFESLGAYVVDGGRTMNPSTAELLAALERSGALEAIVLPNNRNVVLAAEQAAAAATRPVSVIPTETLQAGLAATVAFDPGRSREANLVEMRRASADVATGAVTIASRDLETNGLAIRKGAWLGLAGGSPVAGGETFDEVARSVVERLLERPRGILTFLTGDEPEPLDGLLAALAQSHPELEVEVHDGGQPNYALLVGAE
ncbi:MAG TPA: DAK2 domain-containing protein [Gaiellaceae bacterium]|nr:DAK2 domain-containing protein [Gaiellaceae bacterium]